MCKNQALLPSKSQMLGLGYVAAPLSAPVQIKLASLWKTFSSMKIQCMWQWKKSCMDEPILQVGEKKSCLEKQAQIFCP